MSKEDWDKAAEVYCSLLREGSDVYRRFIYEQAVWELLGEVACKRVLDVGCGEGSQARHMAELGATVVGVDGSVEMLRLARRDAIPGKTEFLLADLLGPLPLPDNSFDLALANMVLMDIPRIETVVSEVARVLVPGGAFVFSITHPCFFMADWEEDAEGRKTHKPLREYLSEDTLEIPIWGKTTHYHRPLSAYFAALEAAGMAVDALREPVPSEETLRERPEWEHHCRIPSFLVMRARVMGNG